VLQYPVDHQSPVCSCYRFPNKLLLRFGRLVVGTNRITSTCVVSLCQPPDHFGAVRSAVSVTTVAEKDDVTHAFQTWRTAHSERELATALWDVSRFPTGMGHYVTFVGSQYKIQGGGGATHHRSVLYHRRLQACCAGLKMVILSPRTLAR